MEGKRQAVNGFLSWLQPVEVLGIGTGTTVDLLIDQLEEGVAQYIVSSSHRTTKRLQERGFNVVELNEVGRIDVYVDGADQVLPSGVSIKGGGGAHTMEKCLAHASDNFVGIVDASKCVELLDFPVAIEVLEAARSSAARVLAAQYGTPVYREGYLTDAHNVILDLHGASLLDPELVESRLNSIPGVIDNGVFSIRRFDHLFVGSKSGFEMINY
ncbi:ribose-5-phosphate isomerase RpiA [Candidatus Comchoanobacter bicostacola]|uniref:Ribose 5-phosphate isomerase A n=1 Tax=Candidatus Comchoanobacter bicostacola TaxID=2919598 RepID=A0ABY5DKU2_9GAMM|nr:ribose-5-phosphate isomerase RpiA [Candidatus Comchoanobacter bicostacola]UTC24504.1 ribose-5-phosphate isomerase RpiA [Candidatus Comchoanobacter bicostacola]